MPSQSGGAALSSKHKCALTETDICGLLISPPIKNAGWDPITRIRRQVTLTPRSVVVRGDVASRSQKKTKFADYVLYGGLSVPIVEANDNNHTVKQVLQQAFGYARSSRSRAPSVRTPMPLPHTTKMAAVGEDIETE